MKIMQVTDLSDPRHVAAIKKLYPQLSTNGLDLETFAVRLSDPDTCFVFALGDDDVEIGMAMIHFFAKLKGVIGLMDEVVVDEGARGQGIGEAICRYLLDQASLHGAAEVTLTSHPRRAEAHRLYKRLGFVERETSVFEFQVK